MAWTTPPIFKEGFYPTETNLGAIADDLDYLHARLGDASWSFATLVDSSIDHTFFHEYRWLIYFGSNGVISDPTGANSATVSLTDATSSAGVYDLTQISWLHIGRRYTVAAVDWCYEAHLVY